MTKRKTDDSQGYYGASVEQILSHISRKVGYIEEDLKTDPAHERLKPFLVEWQQELEDYTAQKSSSSLQQETYGGIALDQALLDLKTQGQFSGYKFDPKKLREISASLAGFESKILSIKRNGNLTKK